MMALAVGIDLADRCTPSSPWEIGEELRKLVEKKARGLMIEILKTDNSETSNVVIPMNALKRVLAAARRSRPNGTEAQVGTVLNHPFYFESIQDN